jgi:diguanylate cyclase (GGDEF)-like protein
MLIRKLIQTRAADAELSTEIRAALIELLFAPVASLIVGAIACSIIGVAVSLGAGDDRIMAVSFAIFAIGMLRVVSALYYRKYRQSEQSAVTRMWERVYEYGAWGFSALLGLLCWMTIAQGVDTTLQMAVSTTAAGYAAAISGRNAGRPFIAVGQLTLSTLPMALALLVYPEWVHKALGVVVLMFIYGMIDITLSIRDIIIQALIVTRKETALAARFAEQANRFDIALNNMSHGLCMLDQQDRLQVWNERFLELLHLQDAPIHVGMRIPQLLRHSMRAGNHHTRGVRHVFKSLARSLQHGPNEEAQTSRIGERIIALSRRLMSEGGSVVILEDVTERERAQERIAHLAKYDELTGLANRTEFRARINEILSGTSEEDDRIAIHLIDLDRFKTINDTLGHPVGDKLLKQVAGRLGAVIGENDMLTRFGGDEFVVLQTATARCEEAHWLAERLAKALEDPFEIDGHRIDIGASIGISMAPADGVDADHLLKKADMALYATKNAGGGGHRFFAAAMEDAVQVRRALELDLRDALAGNQFQLHFQPLVDLRTGEITTCEALLRWSHPTRGNVPPSIFIPVAEETGLIVALGEWILQTACVEAAKWPNGTKVAVNLSPVQFRDRGLALHVASALAKSGLHAQRLELEITERVLLDESDLTLAVMGQLKDLGVGMSLDDFGTGYASFNYLRKFPFHKIKIDQSFIRDLSADRGAQAIITAVATLGASLNKIVVAEGIETEEELKQVRALGCHEGQGYFCGRPVPSSAIRTRLGALNDVEALVA